MSGRFGGVLTAMVTPFDDEGRVDLDEAATLARWLEAHGNDGLIVTGTTGEGPTLTDDERRDMWRAVAEAVSIPVIAGSTSNDTAHSVALTAAAAAAGASGVLVVAPYYNRPSQAGMEAHIRACAGATDLPVVVYDIPVRTGRKVSTEVLLRLARDVPNVVALKDAAGSPAETARLLAVAPSGFECYSGDDALTLPLLAVGAVGVIGVATHWCGVETSEMVQAFAKGDVLAARDINARLIPSWTFENLEDAPNPLPTKAMMRVLGHAVGQCRLPMGDAPDWLEPRAHDVLADLRRISEPVPS